MWVCKLVSAAVNIRTSDAWRAERERAPTTIECSAERMCSSRASTCATHGARTQQCTWWKVHGVGVRHVQLPSQHELLVLTRLVVVLGLLLCWAPHGAQSHETQPRTEGKVHGVGSALCVGCW